MTASGLLKNYFCTPEIRLGLGHRRDRRPPQGVQKGRSARPQRAKRRYIALTSGRTPWYIVRRVAV